MGTIGLFTVPAISEIVQDLLVVMRKHTQSRGEGWNGATTLEQAGIDSLELVELVFDIEDKYNTKVNVKPSDYMLTTVEDVARLVQSCVRRDMRMR
jgi:acyl carrier protein